MESGESGKLRKQSSGERAKEQNDKLEDLQREATSLLRERRHSRNSIVCEKRLLALSTAIGGLITGLHKTDWLSIYIENDDLDQDSIDNMGRNLPVGTAAGCDGRPITEAFVPRSLITLVKVRYRGGNDPLELQLGIDSILPAGTELTVMIPDYGLQVLHQDEVENVLVGEASHL